jgi:kumamolisin
MQPPNIADLQVCQRARVFHDVTSGSNGAWHAGPGWDPVTGWGSPDAYQLVSALTPAGG